MSATEATSHGGSCSALLGGTTGTPQMGSCDLQHTSVPGPLPGVSADRPREVAEQLSSGGLRLRLSYRGPEPTRTQTEQSLRVRDRPGRKP